MAVLTGLVQYVLQAEITIKGFCKISDYTILEIFKYIVKTYDTNINV